MPSPARWRWRSTVWRLCLPPRHHAATTATPGGSAWGHAGNLPGFDTFTAVTEDGRSVFVVVNGRLGDGSVADTLHAAEEALC